MELSVTGECIASILRQVLEACELATEDVQARYGAVREAVVCLNTMKLDELDQVTLASDLHRIVREATGNPDPYRELKRIPTGFPQVALETQGIHRAKCFLQGHCFARFAMC